MLGGAWEGSPEAMRGPTDGYNEVVASLSRNIYSRTHDKGEREQGAFRDRKYPRREAKVDDGQIRTI